MIDQNIIERMNILEPNYANFVKSDFSKLAGENFGAAAKFDETKSIILSNGITLYLLLFLNQSELATFISQECEITLHEAESLATAITGSLPEGLAEIQASAYNVLNETETTTPAPISENNFAADLKEAEEALNNNINLSIAETEAALKAIPNIPHIRTMNKDMEYTQAKNHVPTYTSTQEAILREGRAADTPKTPSWDSQN